MTTWNEIKDRVEIKISEDIDNDDFITLANSALSELNEAAYVEAPAYQYKKENDDIIYENPTQEVFLKDIVGFADGNIYTDKEIILDFQYYVGVNELVFENETESIEKIVEVGTPYQLSNKIKITTNAKTKDTDSFKVTRDIFKNVSNLYNDKYQMIIKLPENFSTITRLEASSSLGTVAIKNVSLNEFDNDSTPRGTNYEELYYIHNGYIYIMGSQKFTNIKLYYARRMNKVLRAPEYLLTTQTVEIDPNFENMLVYSIAHKWLENFVGSEDSETQAVFKKYLTLKAEFEATNVPKRTNRRQSSIDVTM